MGRTLVKQRGRRRRVPPTSGTKPVRTFPRGLSAAVLILAASAIWSYWPILAGLVHALRSSADYSAGQLVPPVAAFLVWRNRQTLRHCALTPCWPAGIMLLLGAEAARIYGLLSMRQSLTQYAIVVALAGVIVLVAGGQVFRRASGILLFLCLMVPLPNMIHSRIGPPLQRLATSGSVFLLEALGTPVIQRGNVVMLNDTMSVAVAEACSGLRMLAAFVIVAAFVAYVVRRPRWQKAALLASSIPIAVLCNLIRISLTALLMLYVSAPLAEKVFHDFAGLVMMPVAVSLLFGELWLMDKLVAEEPGGRPPPAQVIAPVRRDKAAPRKALRT